MSTWRTILGGKRIWYHGTSPKALTKIVEVGYLLPKLADVEEFGEAIWFTGDIEEARMFGTVIFAMTHEMAMTFPHKRISPYPKGFIKRFRLSPPESYTMLIFDKVPLTSVALLST